MQFQPCQMRVSIEIGEVSSRAVFSWTNSRHVSGERGFATIVRWQESNYT